MLDKILSQGTLLVERKCEVQGSIARRILMVDIRPTNDEHLGESFVAVLSGKQQECIATFILRINLEAYYFSCKFAKKKTVNRLLQTSYLDSKILLLA